MLAQIGDGGFEPGHMPWVRKLDRADYLRAVARAELIVAHAGMGTVITAGEHGKPIVLLPRRGPLGEHNNDHQADTAVWLGTRPGILVADDEAELPDCIAAALAPRGGGGRHRRRGAGGVPRPPPRLRRGVRPGALVPRLAYEEGRRIWRRCGRGEIACHRRMTSGTLFGEERVAVEQELVGIAGLEAHQAEAPPGRAGELEHAFAYHAVAGAEARGGGSGSNIFQPPTTGRT